MAVLCWQVERNLSFIWLAVDRRTRFQQHLHRLCLPLPGGIVQRPHTYTHKNTHTHRLSQLHSKIYNIIDWWIYYVYLCFFVHILVFLCLCLCMHFPLTFLVSDVNSSLWLQQQRDELQVAIESRMMQRRKPTVHTYIYCDYIYLWITFIFHLTTQSFIFMFSEWQTPPALPLCSTKQNVKKKKKKMDHHKQTNTHACHVVMAKLSMTNRFNSRGLGPNIRCVSTAELKKIAQGERWDGGRWKICTRYYIMQRIQCLCVYVWGWRMYAE